MEAGTLHCPTCGAAATSDATQCTYCGAQLATVACPSCFGMMFVGNEYCPHCGAKFVQPQSGAPAGPCPRCKTPMHAMALGQMQFSECSDCAGLWIDADTFEKICADRERQSAVL